ncbi:hypothetical protein FOL46_000563 [Perkinsus olseni]|uniref:Uncharacterized protein n=1 Tax=Perkinsus olseni TaxID=32597 RepID=A0A7J6MIX3_PEROL|nr:hypothetical protein FOL46_000563 [Perkinsus olseni]
MAASRSSLTPTHSLRGPVTLNVGQQQQLSDLVESLREQLLREAEERHQLSEWLSVAKTESSKLRSSLAAQQEKLEKSWQLSRRYEEELKSSVDKQENAEKELRECRAELKRAENEIGSFERWKSDNVSVDRAKLLQQIESLKAQVKVAPNGDVQALATEKEELKVRCSKLEESVTSLSARLREVQIQNDTILKTHVDDLRDERTRQQWYLTGGNPNDEVMKGARELRQLRVKAEVDEKMKEDLRGRVGDLEKRLEVSEKDNEELRRELRATELHGPRLLPQSNSQRQHGLDDSANDFSRFFGVCFDIARVHATSCKVYVENAQLREDLDAMKARAENYSTQLEREKMARDIAERQLRSNRKEWELNATSDERRKILEKHHEQASAIAHSKYQAAEEKYQSLANIATESIVIGLVRVRLLRGRDGDEDRMLRIYANDLSRPLLQVLKEDLKVMYIALNVVVLEFLQPIEVMPLAFSSTALLAAVTEVIRAALGSTDCLGTSASQNSECLAQFFPMWLARKVKRSRLRYVGKHLLDTSSIVAAGGAHSAVLNSCPGNVFLFGSNSLGQLGGVGNTQLEEIVTVSCGYGQTAVLLTDGSLYMCGQTPSDASIAGIEVEDPSAWYYRVGRFDKVSLRFKVALVSAGLDFTLLATTEGRVYGQGSNPFGALGIGTIVSTNRPVTDWTPAAIPKGTIAVNLAAGCFHSGIVDHRGWLWVAGSDLHGRLGIGRVHALECEKIPTYERVFGIPKVTAVALGSNHSIVLCQDGDVWGWGSNERGQLGLGYGCENIRPVKLPVKSAVAISAGRSHSATIDSTGGLWTCGDNRRNQCGWGFGDDSVCKFTLVQRSIIAHACGWSHTIALREDGAVLSCGCPDDDRLGVDGDIDMGAFLSETRYKLTFE